MNGIYKDKRSWMITAIIILTAISWFGFIDKYSSEYTHRSILEAGAAYGVSRGINAAVSVAQTSTVQIAIGVGGSITVGEALDPINDLIERFSQVITVALSSLVLQKVLLAIASNIIFKILCTISGALVIALVYLRKSKHLNRSLKVFLILILTRLSLAIVLSMNSLVDNVFLSDKIKNSRNDMQSLQADVENISDEKVKIQSAIDKIDNSLATTEQKKQNHLKKLNNLDQQINSEEILLGSKMDSLDIKTLAKCKVGICPEFIDEIKSNIDKLKSEKKRINNSIENVDDEIDDLNEKRQSYQDTLTGKKPWYDIFPDFVIDLDSLNERISSGVDNIITLLVLFILKTILIPVGFFYLFMRSIKNIWSFDWDTVFNAVSKGIREPLSTEMPAK